MAVNRNPSSPLTTVFVLSYVCLRWDTYFTPAELELNPDY